MHSDDTEGSSDLSSPHMGRGQLASVCTGTQARKPPTMPLRQKRLRSPKGTPRGGAHHGVLREGYKRGWCPRGCRDRESSAVWTPAESPPSSFPILLPLPLPLLFLLLFSVLSIWGFLKSLVTVALSVSWRWGGWVAGGQEWSETLTVDPSSPFKL